MWRRLLSSAWLALTTSVGASAQTTIHVPTDVPTIQTGIEQAHADDTVLVTPDTYPEAIDFLGKAIRVASAAGPAATTIDSQGFSPVVAFANAEGVGSVLHGFTVTGGRSGSPGAGIQCLPGAHPRIELCVVRGNHSSDVGAGVYGDATLEDCSIEDNQSDSGGGGVWGAPLMRRCTVRGNGAYEAAGLQLTGGRLEDCRIEGNVSAEGSQGGAVSIVGSGVVLVRCTIARNVKSTAGQYTARGSGVYAGPTTSPLIAACTVTGNTVYLTHPLGDPDVGGVYGPARLVQTIVQLNDGLGVDPATGTVAIFSDVAGLAGPGNFDADPRFVDAAGGDYRLQPGSPCIDAGARVAPLDPDGTRADVGAFAFAQATVYVRNGSGVNPLILASLSAPSVGGTWSVRVDGTGLAGVRTTLLARTRGLATGLPRPSGELLLDPSSPLLLHRLQASTGGFDDFALGIPGDPALLGLTFHVQALVHGATNRLTNALEVHLGN